MNAARIQRIQSSFDYLAPRADELVERFYATLFATHPEVRSMFPADMNDQRQKLKASIALVVRNVARFEELTPALEQMGARHADYGVLPAHYPIVRDTLLGVMAEMAGDVWTAQLTEDWSAALNAVAGVMINGQQQAGRKAA
ncbi:MAG: hypothetical protein KDA21_08650 [Phycisphaerales bacterium]|nr:hypothetical protein [Phycisphaerales bacterium]